MSAYSFLQRTIFVLLLTSFFTGSPRAELTAEQKAFNEVESYYNNGNAQTDRYEKGRYMNHVIGLYINYINTYSSSKNVPAARFHLGYARQTLGRVNEAKNTYRTLIKRHKKGPFIGSAARQLAYLAYVEQDWEEAAKYFEIAAINLAQENLRYNALTKQVQCLMKLSRDKDVTVVLRKIAEAEGHPYRDWGRFMLGFQYYGAEDYDTTITTLAPLVNEEANSDYRSQALFYTGLSAAELGQDNPASEAHLQTILEMPVDHPSLTPEQKKHLSANKAKAQTALMGLYFSKENWQKVTDLYQIGDFGAIGRVEARRCMRAGNSYLMLGEHQAARASFRKVDRAQPGTDMAFEASFKCLECDYRLKHPGLPERVGIFFELYRGIYPKHNRMEVARFFQAESLFQNKFPEEAANAFSKIDESKIPPSYQAELLFKHGWSLSESGQFDGASRSFGNFIADFPNDPRKGEAHNKRGEAHFALGDYASALRDFETVLSMETTPELTAFALQGSGRVLKEEKKYQAMITRYRRILSDFSALPNDTIANANYWIGWGFYKQDKFEDAPPYLRKARDLVPEFYSQPVGDLLVLTTFNQRDKGELHIALKEVFAGAPAKAIPPHILSWLGVQMYHDGQIEEAADYLQRATNLKSPERTDTRVWRTLAKALNRTRRHEEARNTATLLLKLEKEPRWQADAYLDLAEANLGVDKYDEALQAAEKGLSLNSPGAHIAGLHLIAGEVALLQGRWEDALTSLQNTITMVPDDPTLQPRALHGASLAASQTGDPNQTAALEARLKENFPDFQPTIRLTEPSEAQ